MHSGEITIEKISKIEGSASLKVRIEEGRVQDLKFIIQDYRRFYTEAVKGKPFVAASSFLSRILNGTTRKCPCFFVGRIILLF